MLKRLAAFILLILAASPTEAWPTGGAIVCDNSVPLTCTLPKVPWAGGSAYWSQFAATKAAGWDNPSFFPIGVWSNIDVTTTLTTQAQFNTYKGVGVNFAVPVNQSAAMSLYRTNGFWGVPTKAFSHGCILPSDIGAETVGYFINDEVELFFGNGTGSWSGPCLPRDPTTCIPSAGSTIPPADGAGCGQSVLATNKAALPNDGRPYAVNFAYTILTMSTATAKILVNNFSNMFQALDIYWYGDPNTCAAAWGGAILGTGTTLTSVQCHRSSNYGVATSKLRALKTWQQPTFGFVEDGCINCTSGWASPTGPQLQGAVWNNIINEARGVIYFDANLAGACTGNPIELNCGGINTPITAVNGQINALAPVLNTQSYQWSFHANINSMMKLGPDKKWYIFAMQSGFNDTGTYTFTLPAGMTTASTATVLNESRTVAISGGAFSDTFSNEYSYHIYQVTP